MYFPALFAWSRRLAHGLAYEWFQLALWLAFGLHLITSVRSAFHSGTSCPAAGPPVRPRRLRRPPPRLQPAGF